MRAYSNGALLGLAMLCACASARAGESATTLSQVRAAGELRCGIDVEEAEYSTSDEHGNRQAFDTDLCRAVAVAVLGRDAKLKLTQFPDDRTTMQALGSGDIDIAATLTDDFSHSAGTHLQFTRPVLWDGVGFLLPAKSQVTRARQLSGKKVCFLAGTEVEEIVRAWFGREHLSFVPFPFSEEGEMQAAFATGNCGALAGDRTRLAGLRAALTEHHEQSRMLAERISKDPLATAVRDDDPQWATLVNWVMEALVQAEESGVTQANVEQMHALAALPESSDPTLRFLLGGSHEIGARLGLGDDWVVRVIEAVGNYGEVYDRDLGMASGLKLERGENNLRSRGGLMMAVPAK